MAAGIEQEPEDEDEDADEGTLPLEHLVANSTNVDGLPDVKLFSLKNEAPFPGLLNEGIV